MWRILSQVMNSNFDSIIYIIETLHSPIIWVLIIRSPWVCDAAQLLSSGTLGASALASLRNAHPSA